MKLLAVLTLIALAGCANPRAPANPNSVPNVQQSITAQRDAGGTFIYMTGGFYDGAAVGETTSFLITPDDAIICTFQFDPVTDGDPDVSTVTAHRLTLPGFYGALADVMLPNVEIIEVAFDASFTVEAGSPAGITTIRTGAGDPRFQSLSALFQARPTPCWVFG